jgi:hypothetical protein
MVKVWWLTIGFGEAGDACLITAFFPDGRHTSPIR